MDYLVDDIGEAGRTMPRGRSNIIPMRKPARAKKPGGRYHGPGKVFFLDVGETGQTAGTNYVIQAGDTLYGIANAAYREGGLFGTLYDYNKSIGNLVESRTANEIFPGQEIKLPSHADLMIFEARGRTPAGQLAQQAATTAAQQAAVLTGEVEIEDKTFLYAGLAIGGAGLLWYFLRKKKR